MQMKWSPALPLMLAVGLAGGWLSGIVATPYLATNAMFTEFTKNGAIVNKLSKAPLRTAQTAKVVADNADTLTRSAMLDLASGPLIFEAEIPTESEYWYVSLFAHNTDTFFVGNDQKIRPKVPGRFRLVIRTADQDVPAEVADAVAVSPSSVGFLIVRATMQDRTDADYVNRLREELLQSSIRPLSDL